MSSSSRPATGSVIREEVASSAQPIAQRELRRGDWTRYGDERVLGDATTEHTLGRLADSVRAAAQAQGYSTGWAEGRRKAEAEARVVAARTAEEIAAVEQRREAEHRAAVAAWELAAQRLHDAVETARATILEQATDLAYEIVRELLGRELGDDTAATEQATRRVLSSMPATDEVVAVHLPPAAVSAPAARSLVELGVRLVADTTLGPADAFIETSDRIVDLRLSSALGRVREVLS
ncbi:MAG: FliH/SctL family protein [Nocardioidaceae bacterium]